MNKLGRLAALVLVLSLTLVPGAHAKGKATSYTAPFKAGPTSGDQWAMSNANPEDGRVIIGRMYPIFNPISCAPGGAMAKLQVVHKVTSSMKQVTVTYDQA